MGRKRIVVAVVVLAVGAALIRWKFGADFEPKHLVAQLRALGERGGAPAIFLGLYLVGTTFFLPAVGFHIVAAVVWGYWPGAALSMVALNLSSNLQFLVARWLGKAQIDAWFARRGWNPLGISEDGLWTMIAVRQLPLPFVAVNAGAGASPLKWWHFAVGSGLGAIPPTMIYTWFATSLIEGVAEARTEALLKALAGGVLVICLAVGPRLWLRRRRQRAAG